MALRSNSLEKAAITSVSLCTGAAMLDHGVNLALRGALRPVLYVERETYAVSNLVHQMETGCLAAAPVWSDIATAAGPKVRSYLGTAAPGGVDAVIAGIPCQPWSQIGKRRGAGDERDLWPAALAVIGALRPGLVFIENVAGIIGKPAGAPRIVQDLESLGGRVAVGVFSSFEAGASHRRERVFFLALLGHSADDPGDGETGADRAQGVVPPRRSGRAVAGAVGDAASLLLAEGRGKKPRKGSAQEAPGRPGAPLAAAGRKALAYGNGQQRDRKVLPRRRRSRSSNEGDGLARYAPGPEDFAAWAHVARVDRSRMPAIESTDAGMAPGLAERNRQLRLIGNGVDPLVSAYAFITLYANLCYGDVRGAA